MLIIETYEKISVDKELLRAYLVYQYLINLVIYLHIYFMQITLETLVSKVNNHTNIFNK